MNKLLFLLTIIVITISACTGVNSKKTIEDYLKTKIINPESLQKLTIVKTDTIKSTFMDTKEFKDDERQKDSLVALSNSESAAEIESISNSNEAGKKLHKFLCDEAFKEAMHIMQKDSERMITYKGEFTGYWVRASYSAKDASGNMKSDTAGFELSKDLKTVKTSSGIDL